MRYREMFGKTLRDAPAGSDTASAGLLVRAGFVRQLGAGIHSYLPLAWRSIKRIEAIIREEMERIDCWELSMPVVQPADLWQETRRWYDIGDELVRFQDRAERNMVLAMTHEEVATDLVRREVRSYRQLPIQFFQIQTKFRDEPRPRAGLIRGREFLMKDAYSFHTDVADLERFYNACHEAYLRAFTRCGIEVTVVAASSGIMGGSMSHEFMLEVDAGEDVLLTCSGCGFAANREVATTTLATSDEAPLPMEEVATPGATTIDAVASYLRVERKQTAKAVFYEADDRLIFAVIRGDRTINEAKLAAELGATTLRPADEELLREHGIVAGYASPVGVTGVLVIADKSVRAPNLVAGANRAGYHLRHTNIGRDYTPDVIADILLVEAGDACPQCGGTLRETRGIEVGNIFQLGTKYSAPLQATYLDANDEEHLIQMGSYGFGVSRMLAAIAERHHDDRGLCWPISVAPYDAHLVVLGNDDAVRQDADALYQALQEVGIDTLYDDRDESAGVKFADADLIGNPLRLTVSPRSRKAGGVEIKRRDQETRDAPVVPLSEAVAHTESLLEELRAVLQP